MQATAMKDDTRETWTLKDIEKQETTLQDLRRKLVELDQREAALQRQLADAVEAGEDPHDLRDELEQVRSLVADLRPVEPVLEERIRERRRLAYQERARQELRTLKKRAGGLAGELDRRAEKATEIAEKLEAELEFLARGPIRLVFLESAARLLAREWGLEGPDHKEPSTDVGRVLRNAQRRVSEVQVPANVRVGYLALDQEEPTQGARQLAGVMSEEDAGDLVRLVEAAVVGGRSRLSSLATAGWGR